MKEIALKDGTCALVDDADYPRVSQFKWTWQPGRCGRGVAAYFHRQTILLHNMIAPYEAVSFRNGNKRDCTRGNLIKAIKKCGRKPSGCIRLIARRRQYHISRKVCVGDRSYQWGTAVGFSRIRNQRDAMSMARSILAQIMSLNRDQFISLVLSRKPLPRRPTLNQIVADWSAFKVRERVSKRKTTFNNHEIVSEPTSFNNLPLAAACRAPDEELMAKEESENFQSRSKEIAEFERFIDRKRSAFSEVF